MIWVFAAVVLILAVLSPAFRKVGVVAAGVAVAVVVIVIVANERDKLNPAPAVADSKPKSSGNHKMLDHDEYVIEMADKDDPEAKSRIPVEEIRFGQVQATFGSSSRDVKSIQARLYNNSKHFSLTNYSYYLVVQDCVPAKSSDKSVDQCTTVYDQRKRGTPIVIPPDQARDVSIAIPVESGNSSAPFKILGEPRIELTATETRAYRSPEHPQPADVPGLTT